MYKYMYLFDSYEYLSNKNIFIVIIDILMCLILVNIHI